MKEKLFLLIFLNKKLVLCLLCGVKKLISSFQMKNNEDNSKIALFLLKS
jgi:hypothetical protein